MTTRPGELAPVPSRFDVATLVEQVAARDVVNPEAGARRLFNAIPPAIRADALVQALSLLLQHRKAEAFPRRLPTSPPERPVPAPVEPDPPARSWKVVALRDLWQRRLEQSVVVDQRNVRLADCSAEQLRSAAARFAHLAKKNSDRAAQIILWAEAVEMAQVSRFGDLPENRLKDLLGGDS